MDELRTGFLDAQRQFGARVNAVEEQQWSAPTPDPDRSVADLVTHLIDEHLRVPPLLRGLDRNAAGKVVEGTRSLPVDGGVGANLATAWEEAAAGSAAAIVDPGALEHEVDLARGATPAREYLGELVVDLTVHSWELGAALGYAEPLPDELVGRAWARFQQGGTLSCSGAAAVPVAEDAPPLERLVAGHGRDPNWRRP